MLTMNNPASSQPAGVATITIGDDPFSLSYMNYSPLHYEELLQAKIKHAMAQLPNGTKKAQEAITVIRSPIKYFRNRIRFGIAEINDKHLSYVMWEGGAACVLVEAFPIAASCIYDIANQVLQYIEAETDNELRCELRAIHYLSTLSQELMVTLIYERPLDELTWRNAAEALRCRIALWLPDVKVTTSSLCIILPIPHLMITCSNT